MYGIQTPFKCFYIFRAKDKLLVDQHYCQHFRCILVHCIDLQVGENGLKQIVNEVIFCSPQTVSEDFESVFGPDTDVKEIQITPVQEGNGTPLFVRRHCYIMNIYVTNVLRCSFHFT